MDNALQEGFIRQRRNLMVISLILLFAETSKLSLHKLNVFGNELAIDNPMTVNVALWIAFGYWLWRYYSYFNVIGEKGFWMAQRQRMTELVGMIATKKLQRDESFMKQFTKEGKRYLHITSPIEWYERSLLRFDLKFNINGYSSRYYDDPCQNFVAMDHYIIDDRSALLFAHIRAWIYVLVRTHRFSEYILPFFVATLPILHLVIRTFF